MPIGAGAEEPQAGSPSGPWTPSQWDAIIARDGALLVSAAAGAGKTSVLIERVIRRITDPEDPLDVDRLLMVTFTEAAAAEMREKLGRALRDTAAARPGDARLARQLTLLGRASVSTLHSFCLNVTRQYFHRLGLDPSFKVMNEHEAGMLRMDVLEEVFEDLYGGEEPDSPFYRLVEGYGGGRGDDSLKALVLNVYGHAAGLPWPDLWLEEAAARFRIPEGARLEDLPWWGPVLEETGLLLRRAAFLLDHASALCRRPGGPTAYLENLAGDAEQVERLTALAARGDYAALRDGFSGVVFGWLAAARGEEIDERLKERVQKLRRRAHGIVKDLAETVFVREAGEWPADLRSLAPLMDALVGLVNRFAAAYATAKESRGQVDFSDLERHCLRLLNASDAGPGELRPSDVAEDLRKHFVELLVDEYQDINGLQDAVITLIAPCGSGEPRLFMVGDVKQSIYRFRQAAPDLFIERYENFHHGPAGSALPEAAGRRVVLGENFRSRIGVVEAVNFFFRQIMTRGVGETAYDREAELVAGATYPDNDSPLPVEVHILERDDSAAGDGGDAEGEDAGRVADAEELSALEREARVVARRLREMLDGGVTVWDGRREEYRPLACRDVAVLLRSPSGRASVFVDNLRRAGIPAYAREATGYFAATEVATILSLLAVIDNPRQDIALAAVLRSPIGSMDEADLARVRLAGRGDYFDALAAAGKAGGDDATEPAGTAGKARRFLDRLRDWRTMARSRPLSSLVWHIYRDTDYLDFVSAQPGGPQRRANLLALHDRARQFDHFSRQGLDRFLRFMERLRERGEDLGAAPAIGEAEDVVRIMSVHAGKGLEFPVVFMAGLGTAFNRQDLRGDVLVHRDLGLGPMVADVDRRVRYPSLAHRALCHRKRLEGLAEEMRILYVALTRAREHLVLVGSARGVDACCEDWAAAAATTGWPLDEARLAGGSCFLDWIMPALARHRDGTEIRKRGGFPVPPADGEVAGDFSRWLVRLWLAGDITPAQVEPAKEGIPWGRIVALEPIEGERVISKTGGDLRERIAARLDWRYPHGEVTGRFAKVTVSEVKGRFDPFAVEGEDAAAPPARTFRPVALERPRFTATEAGGLTAAERGAAVHLTVQHLNLSRPLDADDIEDQLAAMVAGDLLTPEQAAAVDVRSLARFFGSTPGSRLRARPDMVRREMAFYLALPAHEVYPDLDGNADRVVVQGMIDALVFGDDGSITILDFKTGDFPGEDGLADYRGQVNLYARAAAGAFRRPVTEALLIFLDAGLVYTVPIGEDGGGRKGISRGFSG